MERCWFRNRGSQFLIIFAGAAVGGKIVFVGESTPAEPRFNRRRFRRLRLFRLAESTAAARFASYYMRVKAALLTTASLSLICVRFMPYLLNFGARYLPNFFTRLLCVPKRLDPSECCETSACDCKQRGKNDKTTTVVQDSVVVAINTLAVRFKSKQTCCSWQI